MEAPHHYQIAGYRFRFAHRPPAPPPNLPDGYAPFRLPPDSDSDSAPAPAWDGEYTFASDAERPEDPPDPRACYLDCATWRFGRTLGGRLYMDTHYVPNRFWQPAAYLEPDFSSGLLFPRKYDAQTYFPYSFFFPIDEQLLLNRMAVLGGSLIHCCGIDFGGRALLFCGKSGAGKSTTAELWREAGARLLNDDRMVIRPSGEHWVAAPTPWHGTIREIHPAMLPIAAVFHLKQARDNRVNPIPYPHSAHRLLANAIAPFYFKDSMTRVLQSLTRAMVGIPSYDLYFTPDQRAVEACLRVIDAHPQATP